MEQNKLKPGDLCLTIEQAKELADLGIDMGNTLFDYIQLVSDKKYIEDAIEKRVLGEPFLYNNNLSTLIVGGNEMYKLVTHTLTNSEMLEILPKSIMSDFNSLLSLYVTCRATHDKYQVQYMKHEYSETLS